MSGFDTSPQHQSIPRLKDVKDCGHPWERKCTHKDRSIKPRVPFFLFNSSSTLFQVVGKSGEDDRGENFVDWVVLIEGKGRKVLSTDRAAGRVIQRTGETSGTKGVSTWRCDWFIKQRRANIAFQGQGEFLFE